MNAKLATLALLGLTTFAPLALAEDNETEPQRPDDAAWVEDCPPDMMCSAECISCSQAPSEGDTCMDGAQEDETCHPDDVYLGGSEGDAAGPPRTESVTTTAEKDVSALPALGVFAALALGVVLASRRA